MAERLEEVLERLKGRVEDRKRSRPVEEGPMVAPQSEEPKAMTILEMEQLGFFTIDSVCPRNEYPTLLTRLPIFPPIRRQRQKTRLDKDNALVFQTPFGTGRRHGPLLTVEDEDTLIVLLMLRDRKLLGQAGRLPFPVAATYPAEKDNLHCVHIVNCTVSQILSTKGLTDSGQSRRWTLDSIKRLAATTLEINLKKHERYFGQMTKGTTIKLLDVIWSIYETEGYLQIQFTPIVARWLQHEYTLLNWRIRSQLTELGKAIHRFLSSQPREYSGKLLSIAETIGCDIPQRNLRVRFREALDQMKGVGWLKEYRFEGTGRTTPIVLYTVR